MDTLCDTPILQLYKLWNLTRYSEMYLIVKFSGKIYFVLLELFFNYTDTKIQHFNKNFNYCNNSYEYKKINGKRKQN